MFAFIKSGNSYLFASFSAVQMECITKILKISFLINFKNETNT